MKGSSMVASKAALALLAADAVFADVLTTIEPCPSATGLSIAPITVTSQYQAVSTCQPTSACVKGKCSTAYDFTTYPYVSTVVPYAWNGTTTQSTTVTDVSQPVRVSEHLSTLTQVTAAPTLDKRWGFGWGEKEVVEYVTVYETVTRRAMAPFMECGPLPIPGWEGSGLCESCESSGSQLLDVVECRFGTDAYGDEYQSCSEWYETLYERVAPTTTVEALCSSTGSIPSAGVYTWTFPQAAAPVTVTAPPTTVTVYIEEQPSVTVIPEEIQIIEGESWNAYVTKTFGAATIFDFEIYITQPIVYAPFPATLAATSTAAVTVPTGSAASKGSWPLPESDEGGNANYAASSVWADWTGAAASGTGLVGPVGASTSGTGLVGPIGASTSSSSSSSTSSASSSNNIGPISASTSTSSSSTSTSSSASSTTSSSSSSSSSSTSSTTTTTSTSSTSTSSTTSTTTTTTTTTTGGTAVTIGVGFYLEIVATPVAKAKRQDVAVEYLAFDANNNGIAVSSTDSAALVFNGEGNALVSDGMYLGTPADDTSLVERTSDLPEGFTEWYFVGQTAQLQGTAGFCLGANGSVTAYVASDGCSNPIYLVKQITTSSTNSSSSTSATSSTATSNATTTTSGASNGTATSTSSASVGPISASTTASNASSTASSTGAGSATSSSSSSTTASLTSSATGNSSTSATGSGSSSVTSTSTSVSSSSTLSSTSSTSSGLTISVSVGPISITTSSSSSSSSGTATATTSTSSTSAAAICNINANICPDSELITANTVATSDCAVGVTCTVDELAELVPDLLTQNPSIATVLLGDNQVIGLSITPQDVEAAIANGTVVGDDVCSALEEVTVQIDDPTCITGTTTTTSSSSSTTSTSSTSSTTGDFTSTSSSSMVTSTTSATTTTDDGTTSTTSTTSSATASSTLLCGVELTLCAGQTLADLGLNQVTCGTTGVLNSTLCDSTEVLEAAADDCVLSCQSYGSVLTTNADGTTANLDPVIGTEDIQSIQAQVDTADCVPSSTTVTLSDPACPVTALRRRSVLRHARARYAY
ncbi:hypothetical protein EDD37DRAFT_663993 [Exophiala viscosa]|uniref:uncharacterized protein n=1 Tax=Exophiala viscosa TaxID=2486360 RepID=UPI00219CEACB|nr:hypothetical protein EDD37DRAFT_663993 [Exophiala viscosa]